MTQKPFWRRYVIEIFAIVFGLIAMNAVLLASAYWETDTINPATAGQLGDFVGGYIGTAFALLSVLFLYRTLRTQREGAQQQFFESKYFELIKMHRDNVAEMRLQSAEGRRVFLPIVRELWAALDKVKIAARLRCIDLNQRQLLHIAYYFVFYGVGPSSSPMLKAALRGYDSQLIDEIERWLLDKETRQVVAEQQNLSYTPFEGHQSRLGHYYRHLYQTVAYVHSSELAIDHYAYVKTVRAQLSTHEQVLLLINSICPIGEKWWNDGFMLRYRVVKNIPEGFFHPTDQLDLQSIFPNGYFEWEECTHTAGTN